MHIYSRGGCDEFLSLQKILQYTAPSNPPLPPNVITFPTDLNRLPKNPLLTLPVI